MKYQANEERMSLMYARIVCIHIPQKEEVNRTRIAVGGNLINYPFDCGTPTVDLITVKLLLNSVTSTPHASWMTLDIKNFYLITPMKQKEYTRMELKNFPEDVIEHYKLRDIEKDVTPGRDHSTRVSRETLTQAWIQTKSAHTRIVDPQMEANILLFNCG